MNPIPVTKCSLVELCSFNVGEQSTRDPLAGEPAGPERQMNWTPLGSKDLSSHALLLYIVLYFKDWHCQD
jgi:hypothetical protein